MKELLSPTHHCRKYKTRNPEVGLDVQIFLGNHNKPDSNKLEFLELELGRQDFHICYKLVDTFSLPSACICYHRKTDLIRIRGLANFNSPSMSDSTEDPNELNEDNLFSFRSPLPFGDVKCLNDSQVCPLTQFILL